MTDFSPAFLGMFESLRMGPTFARGRRDERAGHVRSLTVSGSLVVALVRGPEDAVAFRSRIAVRAFGASEWSRVEKALVGQAGHVADLLDGRMPPGIEAMFAGAGLSLLPLSLDEVAMDCTCERWPMPCAHLAATCYALARAFESDPFEVFTWRGRPRDELLMRLRRLREAAAVDAAGGDTSSGRAQGVAGDPSSGPGQGVAGDPSLGDPSFGPDHSAAGGTASGQGRGAAGEGGGDGAGLLDPAVFWGVAEPSEPYSGDAAGGVRPDALLDQLDAPGLSHLGQPITTVLRPAYRALPDAG